MIRRSHSYITCAVMTFLALARPATCDDAHSAPIPRKAFVSDMARVQTGMQKPEVASILGSPDEIRPPTEDEVSDYAPVSVKQVWCYGIDGPAGLPTLGRVIFAGNDRVVRTVGGAGSPPEGEVFTETELRPLLRLIDMSSQLVKTPFNPRTLIQIVNGLQPLGKRKALAAIEEYIRISLSSSTDTQLGLLLVLRVLFVVPADRGMLPFGPWFTVPPPPKDPNLVPLFPIVVVDGIPLMLAYEWFLVSQSPRAADALPFFRQHALIRPNVLSPSARPLLVLDKLTKSPQWLFVTDYEKRYPSFEQIDKQWQHNIGLALIRNELLSLVDTVYCPKIAGYPKGFVWYMKNSAEEWTRVVKEFSALSVRWDAQKNSYVLQPTTEPSPTSGVVQELPVQKLGPEHEQSSGTSLIKP